MSRYGMKVADETVYNIKSPDQVIELFRKLLEQYFGEFWTQFKPRCPLCNEPLSDCERHMNRPVGECTNEKCESTIHISDYLGKMQDVIKEWDLVSDKWLEKVQEHVKKSTHQESTSAKFKDRTSGSAGSADTCVNLHDLDEDTVYVW